MPAAAAQVGVRDYCFWVSMAATVAHATRDLNSRPLGHAARSFAMMPVPVQPKGSSPHYLHASSRAPGTNRRGHDGKHMDVSAQGIVQSPIGGAQERARASTQYSDHHYTVGEDGNEFYELNPGQLCSLLRGHVARRRSRCQSRTSHAAQSGRPEVMPAVTARRFARPTPCPVGAGRAAGWPRENRR